MLNFIRLPVFFSMCVSPIRIKNRCSHFDENQPLYFYVPCGHCYDCLKNKRNEWYVRCYYEYKHASLTYFYTLTYDNEHLPVYMGKPCFSKRDVQLFVKRLRARLSEYGVSLKYLITSEYGERYGRPHYHALFFLYGNTQLLNHYLFYKLLNESWSYGFTKYGDNIGFVSNYRGIQYVVKYVTKDYTHSDDFFDTLSIPIYHRYNRLLTYIEHRWKRGCSLSLFLDRENRRFYARPFDCKKFSEDSPYYDFANTFISKVRSVLNKRMPFHLQSTKLGYDYALHDKSKLMLDNVVFAPSNKQILPYALPRAWRRLFWYDCVENEHDHKNTKFVLNELGKQHYLSNLPASILKVHSDLMGVRLNWQYIDDNCLKLVNDLYKYKQRFNFKDVHELVSFIQSDDSCLETLAIYISVFRDRIMPPELVETSLTPSVVRDNYLCYAEFCLTSLPYYDYGKIYELFEGFPKEQMFSLVTWNAHPFFIIYERLAQIYQTIQNYQRTQKANAAFEKERLLRNVREYFTKT